MCVSVLMLICEDCGEEGEGKGEKEKGVSIGCCDLLTDKYPPNVLYLVFFKYF